MVYNEKYNLYVSKEGVCYRFRKSRLIYVKPSDNHGYERILEGLVHRIVWETFNGEIPSGYEIDHINGNRSDNRLENLQLLTKLENIQKANKDKPCSYFGEKFKEHYGFITQKENKQLYEKEYMWYKRHNNTLRWEFHSKVVK